MPPSIESVLFRLEKKQERAHIQSQVSYLRGQDTIGAVSVGIVSCCEDVIRLLISEFYGDEFAHSPEPE